MAQFTAPRQSGMGPGFWPVTWVLTVINALISAWIVWLPIDKYLPIMGSPGPDIDLLFKFMSVTGNALFVYVTGYLIFFSVAWRRKKTDSADTIGIQIHDNAKLELWWTIIPAIFVVILAVFSIRIWAGLQSQPTGGIALEAIGHQFNYEYRYPGLKDSVYSASDALHLPVNVPVTMYVTAADVIHSFWIPEIRIKADMVPGNVQPLRFTPTQIGDYRLICTEFCGSNHGKMNAAVKVESMTAYTSWLASKQHAQTSSDAGGGVTPAVLSTGTAAAGQVAFSAHCATCHNAGAAFEGKIVGPGLLHLTDNPAHPKLVTGDGPSPANIASLLQKGYSGSDQSSGAPKPAIGAMPNAQGNGLSNKDIANLTAYLVSLK